MKPIEFLRLLPARLTLRSRGGAGRGPWDAPDASEQGVADLLAWYAAEMSINTAVLSGTRSAVLTAVAVSAAAAPARVPAISRAPGRREARSPRSRLLAFTAATSAVAILVVAFGASQTSPGQAFYHTRLDLEAMGLPPAGSSARVDADLSRAEARLNEIAGESAQRDWTAVADAANAYTAVLAQMSIPDDDTDRDALQGRLTEQLARLQMLRVGAPEGAAAALDKAIARVQSMLAEADRKDKEPKPTKEPNPTKEPKPTKEPRPAKT